MDIERAVEVFVTAFSQSKSVTYPYPATQVAPSMWVMQDDPPRKRARKSEVISVNLGAEEAIPLIKSLNIGWHFLCEIHTDDADYDRIRNEYKERGYRAVSTEWVYYHPLDDFPILESDPPVTGPLTPETLAQVNQVASQPQKLQPNTDLFTIHNSERDMGWVRHVPVGEDAWVSALYVHEAMRGKGYGRALMSKILQHTKATGLTNSVLIASSDGARLYPHLGYRKIATLQIFCPTKR